MTQTLLIYGATGYTGKLIAAEAAASGINFEIAGRNQAAVQALAAQLNVPYRIFAVDDAAAVKKGLEDITVLLNCAGPFAATARQFIDACIENGVHYLDITAEYNVYAYAEAQSAKASKANTMLLPGVGWDVVPSDSLAAYTAAKVAEPTRLRIALEVAGSMSRGSANSVPEIIAVGSLIRKDGQIVPAPDADTVLFDFGDGEVECYRLSFGDLITAWTSTAIPNIEMYVHMKADALPDADNAAPKDGPSQEQRDANPARAVAEVTGANGEVTRAVIETINGYSYTPLSAVAAAKRVMEGDAYAGFQTPAMLFGPMFAADIAGTRIIDLPSR